jgi:sarcosine oxidase/L-pipecolate oxidase
MLARAMRHSESTIAFQVCVVPVEVPFSLHVYKNGEKRIMTNYRSIFLSLSFSKISEKLTFTRLLQHFANNNILPKEQFSFKSNSPTDKAIFKLLNEILNALSNKLMISGIFCDLEKAYDSVDHNILLSKLQYYGIMGSIYTLIQSYVTGRYQHIAINSKIFKKSLIHMYVELCILLVFIPI